MGETCRAAIAHSLARTPRQLARRALVIGVSTGGPAALTEVLPLFPASFPVPVTGMGQDGLKGTRMLAELGAYVVAQDEATSVVWECPAPW